MSEENKSPNTSRNGVAIQIGDLVQCDDGYVGRVVAIDGGAILFRPHGGQRISSTSYSDCDECIVLTEPEMATGSSLYSNGYRIARCSRKLQPSNHRISRPWRRRIERIKMLALSRNPGEKIFIGPDIIVEIVAVRGDQVRLAISAPRNVIVDREEIRARRLADDGGGYVGRRGEVSPHRQALL